MHEYTSTVRVWGLTCPGSPEEVGRARRWTRDILSDHPCAEDAELIVSELGTNALTHTASGQDTGTFHVALALADRLVLISVTDSGSTDSAPHIEHPDGQATHGRGLELVAALAGRLRMHGNEDGRTVEVELPLTPADTPGPQPQAKEHQTTNSPRQKVPTC